MNVYTKNNGMGRVYLIGVHPLRDFVAVSSGGDDIRWVSLFDFHSSYTPSPESDGGEK